MTIEDKEKNKDKEENKEEQISSSKDENVPKKSKNKFDLTGNIRKNPWMLSTILLSILVLVLLVISFTGNLTGNVISADAAGQKLLDFYTSVGVEGLELNSVKEVSGLYEVNFSYQDQTISLYMTKDGKNAIESLLPLEIKALSDDNQEIAQEIPKSDKPVVDLFVMSFCPYGTQAEKGIIPVAKLLGDKIDFNIRYVYYAMHGEPEVSENLREYCIQKQQPDKFLDYMTCFLGGDGSVDPQSGLTMNSNDVDSCLKSAGIDTKTLNSCMSESDLEFDVTSNLKDSSSWLSGRYPLFNVDKVLNEKYGIQGSPSLVINGQEVSSGRDPASYLKIICSAFNEVPEECETQLSSETPSPYFGWDSTGASTSATC